MDPDIRILMVDDDDLDVEAFQFSVEELGLENSVETVSDGLKALEILQANASLVVDRKRYVVILDLNMPRMNGHQFLAAIRENENLHRTVVFILTTSSDANDRRSAYAQNVAGYMVKGNAGEFFCDAVQMVAQYCSAVTLPQ